MHEINSREWWDHYFREQWDAHGGGAQTRHFMERLIANLPDREYNHISTVNPSILDWGCAFGEGVALLAETFPTADVWGLDFSWPAVEQARRRHPGRKFIHDPDGEIPRPFDIVITSNCLEHFDDPLPLVRRQLALTNQLYVLLVPNEENPLHFSHRIALSEAAFPERLDTFTKIWGTPIRVDPRFWPGDQLLVIYASPAYLDQAGQLPGLR